MERGVAGELEITCRVFFDNCPKIIVYIANYKASSHKCILCFQNYSDFKKLPKNIGIFYLMGWAPSRLKSL